MLWEFIKRHRRKLFIISLLTGGGYATVRFLNEKLSTMLNEQDKMIDDWKKQLYYEHNRDTSLRTTTEIFGQVIQNINRAFECETILSRLSSTSDSAEKRQLWEQLRIECFARLFTFAYSSSFVLALTELVVSALSGRLYAEAHSSHSLTAAGGISATTKSSHAESVQEHSSILSRDVQLACLDVIRYTTEAGMNQLIGDVRKATHSILSRIPLQQTMDINDVIWYCSEIRHQIEKKRFHHCEPKLHPLLKYVRSDSFPRRERTDNFLFQPTTTTTTTTNSVLLTHKTSPIFNLQEHFELECIEIIESEAFQRVLLQIVERSFSNIFDEFAREMNKQSDHQSAIIIENQIPLAKIIPISNNIYSKLSGQTQQLTIHFQSLACQPELHEYTKHVYDKFSNQLASTNIYPSSSSSSLQSRLTSLFRSIMSP